MKIVFTDGSASPNPGMGGFSVIDGETGNPLILGRSDFTTNIVMEATAIGFAMAEIPDAEIHTDSEFWINVLTKWAPKWAENGWKKGKGEIKNLAYVKRLYELYNEKKPKLVYVRGHIGTEMNEKADEWAKKARERESFNDLEIIEVKPIKKEEG